MRSDILSICTLVRSELENVDCELVDLEVKRVFDATLLRVYVDKAGGVTVKEIAEITRDLRDRLDETGIFGSDYKLEVSSPGASRSLRGQAGLDRFAGKQAVLYLKNGGRKVGVVLGSTSTSVAVRTDEGDKEEIQRDDIRDMHLLYFCT